MKQLTAAAVYIGLILVAVACSTLTTESGGGGEPTTTGTTTTGYDPIHHDVTHEVTTCGNTGEPGFFEERTAVGGWINNPSDEWVEVYVRQFDRLPGVGSGGLWLPPGGRAPFSFLSEAGEDVGCTVTVHTTGRVLPSAVLDHPQANDCRDDPGSTGFNVVADGHVDVDVEWFESVSWFVTGSGRQSTPEQTLSQVHVAMIVLLDGDPFKSASNDFGHAVPVAAHADHDGSLLVVSSLRRRDLPSGGFDRLSCHPVVTGFRVTDPGDRNRSSHVEPFFGDS